MLEIKSVSKSFNGTCVLHDVSFELAENAILVITGKNGSGKTTLLKILAGLLKPDSGQIILGNTSISNRKNWLGKSAFIAHIALIADSMSVSEIIKFYAEFFVAQKIRLSELISLFELENLLSSKLSRLSAGEKKRVNLVTALLREPELLLLDEPLANLDIAFRDKMIQLLAKISEISQIIITTHNLQAFQELKPRIGLLKQCNFFEPPENSELSFEQLVKITETELIS